MRLARRFTSLVEETLPAYLLGAMVASIVYSVISRYGFSRPVTWANELAVALSIWQVFLASAGAARRRMHIGVEVLVNLLPPRGRAIQELVVNAVVLVVLGWFVYLGYRFSLQPTKQLRMIGLDYTWIYRAVPAGFGLLAVHIAVDMWSAARGAFRDDYQPPKPGLEALTNFQAEDASSADLGRRLGTES